MQECRLDKNPFGKNSVDMYRMMMKKCACEASKGKKTKKKREFQKKGVEKVTKSALGGSSIGRVNRRIGKVGKT